MSPTPGIAKFALLGVIYHPDKAEMPWLLQDNRKAAKSEYPCATKADVLSKIGIILDDMSQSKG
jgi:hypothetical protein